MRSDVVAPIPFKLSSAEGVAAAAAVSEAGSVSSHLGSDDGYSPKRYGHLNCSSFSVLDETLWQF